MTIIKTVLIMLVIAASAMPTVFVVAAAGGLVNIYSPADIPFAVPVTSYELKGGIAVDAGVPVHHQLDVSDTDGDPLEAIVQAGAHLGVTVVPEANGLYLNWTPKPEQAGYHIIDVEIRDKPPTGRPASIFGTIIFRVYGQNEAPSWQPFETQ